MWIEPLLRLKLNTGLTVLEL